jgi:hypothetical protein
VVKIFLVLPKEELCDSEEAIPERLGGLKKSGRDGVLL